MKLEGIKVVDLSMYLPGPHLTLMMADHGAEVIRVEPPEGEPSRNYGPFQNGHSVWFRNTHRGKKSICLNLKDEKERKILQSLVDEMFGRFKAIVKEGRPKLDDEQLSAVATGQIFTAAQAKQSGLIDKVGFIEDAIERAIELAGLTEDSTRVVKYSRPKGVLDELLGGSSVGARQTTALEALAEWTTPRAWYLCSWWPALITNR